jgi:hypothetical protein
LLICLQVFSDFCQDLSQRGFRVYDAYMCAWRQVRGVNLFSYGDYPACCDVQSHCLRGYLGSFKTKLVGMFSKSLKTMVYPGAGRYLPSGHPLRAALQLRGQLGVNNPLYVRQDGPPPERMTHDQVMQDGLRSERATRRGVRFDSDDHPRKRSGVNALPCHAKTPLRDEVEDIL